MLKPLSAKPLFQRLAQNAKCDAETRTMTNCFVLCFCIDFRQMTILKSYPKHLVSAAKDCLSLDL